MSARENILKAISANKPAFVPLPEVNIVSEKALPVEEAYTVVLKNIGGIPIRVRDLQEAKTILEKTYSGKRVIDMVFDPQAQDESVRNANAHDLESVYVTYLKGSLGVAENGSIWIKEPSMKNRLVPVICEHLVIVLNISDLVYTMHEAYERIKVNEYGYGVFIAGPSKTADIEQALVIGAHGPRSLEVFLVG